MNHNKQLGKVFLKKGIMMNSRKICVACGDEQKIENFRFVKDCSGNRSKVCRQCYKSMKEYNRKELCNTAKTYSQKLYYCTASLCKYAGTAQPSYDFNKSVIGRLSEKNGGMTCKSCAAVFAKNHSKRKSTYNKKLDLEQVSSVAKEVTGFVSIADDLYGNCLPEIVPGINLADLSKQFVEKPISISRIQDIKDLATQGIRQASQMGASQLDSIRSFLSIIDTCEELINVKGE